METTIREYQPTDKNAVIDLIRQNTPAYFAQEEEADFSNYLDSEGNVLIDGLFKELVLRILEHQAHLKAHLANFLGPFPNVRPIQQDLPVRGTQQPIQMLDKGRFSRPGVADDAQKLPGHDLQVHVINGFVLKRCPRTVGVRESLYF